MAENAEFEDHVELDDDNYTEEEDDVEEPMEDEGFGEGGEENCEDFQEDIRSGESGKEHSLGVDTKNIHVGVVDDEGNSPAKEAERKKHAELLSLPPHGSEVFIGGLPRDILEEALRELCESFGEIFELRVMKNRDTGESKGFAFVAFRAKDMAQKAIEELHNKEFKGRTLRCSLSESKYRLFIGNVPKAWTDDEFRKIIEAAGPGAETIELIKEPQNPGRNRGFAFVEYYNNACAHYSRQQMSAASFKLDGNTPTVTWADPKITPDHSAAASQMRSTSCNMLVVVLKDMKDGLDIVQNKIHLLTAKVEANNFPTSDGISYLEAKHLLLLSYCQSLVYYLLRKAKGLSIHGHPVVKSLVEVRLFLEKIRPVDKKLQYQIQKLTKVTATNTTADTPGPNVNVTDEAHEKEDLLRYRPNPDLLVSKTNENQEDGSSVYRPPKFAPSSMDEDKMIRQERNAMRKEKETLRRAKQSAYVRELINDLEGKPEEIREHVGSESREVMRYVSKMEERARQEEELFTRAPLTKEEKKKMKYLKKSRNGLNDLTESFFDEVKALPMERSITEQPASFASGDRKYKKRKRKH